MSEHTTFLHCIRAGDLMADWLEEGNNSVRLRIRVQPRAAATSIAGEYGDALRIRVAAPPVDGAANHELVRFLAKRLRVPASAITIVHGHTGRTKLLDVQGVTPESVRRLLI